MANNGYKQATIAYKIDQEGNPVDVNGQLTSISGRRQAIALIQGKANPNPSIYEVELVYVAGGDIQGTPSVSFDVKSCPFGYFLISPEFITLTEGSPTATITLESSSSWQLINAPQGIAALDVVEGSAGVYLIQAHRVGDIGQGPLIFKNVTGQTVSIWVSSVITTPWVLETGNWNMLGFWFNGSIWNN